MEIVLLGTGAADGWPNPFCRCDSCTDAVRRGELRGQTAALLDDVLLLDCGPEAPGAAVRHGRTLAGVKHLLITHAHPDHLGPQMLLSRSWAHAGRPVEEQELEVIGPADALDTCRPWVGPDEAVRFVPVEAGDRIQVGGYDVRVLPARHRVFRDGDAVLYDVAGPDGSRILWASDTGPWPDEWFPAVRDARFDAVFLEETLGDREEISEAHLGLPRFGRMVRELRAAGAVIEHTDIVAVHLGHHNPPLGELDGRLAEHGARAGRDGEVVAAGPRDADARAGNSRVGAGVVMDSETGARRTLVLGGVRSGKSRYAERLAARHGNVVYVATGGAGDGDAEWAERVAEHRRRRPATWTTLETNDVAGVLRTATAPLLVDCLGTWLTARMDLHDVWNGGDLGQVRADIDELLEAWSGCPVPVVGVSNEVGSGVVPASASGRMFRDLLGRLNSEVAERSESVVLTVAGQPIVVR